MRKKAKKKKKHNQIQNLLKKSIFLLLGITAGLEVRPELNGEGPLMQKINNILRPEINHPPLETGQEEIEVRFSPRGGCTKMLVNLIDEAKETLHIYIFSFTSQPIYQAILRAKKRGVKIYIITNKTYRGQSSKIELLAKVCHDLYIDRRSGVAHHKFMIIDRKRVATGSFNYSKNAEQSNRENLLCIREIAVAELYYKEWEKQSKAQKVIRYATL